jgi:enterochelin esterase-like enzyme
MMAVLGRCAVGICAVVLALAGCGGGKSKMTPSAPSTGTPVTAAPMTPTGSGSALDETYHQRCSASLSDERPARARGKGSLRELRLRSPDSSRTLRSVFVYRPGGVKDTAKLPVVYVLHGLPGDPAAVWTNFHAASLLDAEFAHGAAPYEVVTLDGRGAKHPDTEWADSLDGADKVETFVLRVAIPAVEGTHRRDACHRAIAGFSMGGYGAMNLAQRHPDVFGQVASIAGYFHIDDPDHVFGSDRAVQRANSPDLETARAKGLRVFLLEPGQESSALIKGEGERFAKLLVKEKIPVLLDFSPGVHNNEYAIAQQPAISNFLESGWRPDAG